MSDSSQIGSVVPVWAAPGGGGTLQEAYDGGNTIALAAATPVQLTPNAATEVVIDILTRGAIRLADADDSNTVTIQAPADVTANYTLNLPQADGAAGEALVTDGAGNLSFTAVGGVSSMQGAYNGGPNLTANATDGPLQWDVAAGDPLAAGTALLQLNASNGSGPALSLVGGGTDPELLFPTAVGATATIQGADAAGGSGNGGIDVQMLGGDGDGAGAGGFVGVAAGDGGATGNGGSANLLAGDGGGTSGNGGVVSISGGAAPTSGTGGDVGIAGGTGNPTGGSITLTPGNGGTTHGAVALLPPGTGVGDTAELRFRELAANGSNYVGFKSADALAGNQVWVLPTADGSNGDAIITDGAGNLSFGTPSSATTATELSDADGDTTVEVESGADDDVIRMGVGDSQGGPVIANAWRLVSRAAGLDLQLDSDGSHNVTIFHTGLAGAGNTLSIEASDSSGSSGGAVQLVGGDGSTTGGSATVVGGASTGGGSTGGQALLLGGAATAGAGGTGGSVTVDGGTGNVGGAVNVTAGTSNDGAGAAVGISSSAAGGATGGAGGALNLVTGGGAGPTNAGGSISATLGAGGAADGAAAGGTGGGISLPAGTGGAGSGTFAAGAGGQIDLTAGTAGADGGGGGGAGGAVNITAGTATGAANSGNVVITAPQAPGAGTDGQLQLVVGGVTYTWPTVDGANGDVLQTNGAGTLSFVTPASQTEIVDADGDTSVQVEAGADDDVVRFNLGDAQGGPVFTNAVRLSSEASFLRMFLGDGDSDFTITMPTAPTAAGGTLFISTGDGASETDNGGTLQLDAGNGGAAAGAAGGGTGGAITITAGDGGAGDATFTAGIGGALTLAGGAAGADGGGGGNNGGQVSISGGAATAGGDPGDVIITAPTAPGAGTNAVLQLVVGGTTYTWPTADGANGEVLQTDGAGNLSFAAASGGVSAVRNTFVDGDLTSGVLSVNHALGVDGVVVEVFDNNNDKIVPDNINLVDTNNVDIDLTTFGALTGTWRYVILG